MHANVNLIISTIFYYILLWFIYHEFMKSRHLKEEIPALDIISSFEHRTPKRTPTSCDTTMASPHPAGRSSGEQRLSRKKLMKRRNRKNEFEVFHGDHFSKSIFVFQVAIFYLRSLRSSRVILRRSISITGLPLPANCFGLRFGEFGWPNAVFGSSGIYIIFFYKRICIIWNLYRNNISTYFNDFRCTK